MHANASPQMAIATTIFFFFTIFNDRISEKGNNDRMTNIITELLYKAKNII